MNIFIPTSAAPTIPSSFLLPPRHSDFSRRCSLELKRFAPPFRASTLVCMAVCTISDRYMLLDLRNVLLSEKRICLYLTVWLSFDWTWVSLCFEFAALFSFTEVIGNEFLVKLAYMSFVANDDRVYFILGTISDREAGICWEDVERIIGNLWFTV